MTHTSRRAGTGASLLMAVVALAAMSGCAHAATGPQSVTIMTFNVENLFDTADDPDKDDATFLPLAAKQSVAFKAGCAKIDVESWRNQCLHWDWNEKVLARKLEVLARAILQVGDGRGADIIALQEVENLAVLERLRTEYLGAAGYLPAVLIEGADLRGIDVAFLSRLPLAGKPRLHPIAFDANVSAARIADTRGILEAEFTLPDGSVLTGFSVHFPAPFHPTEMRISAYRKLQQLLTALPAERAAFAAGDFNTTSAEDRDRQLLAKYVRPAWTVAHETGCKDCRGSQYYAPDDSWSFLDMILWSPSRRGADATWRIRADSVQLANLIPEQVHRNGTPARFNVAEMTGVSDHWPLIVTLETK